MKKWIIALLLVALTLGLCACGASNASNAPTTQNTSDTRKNFDAATTYIESTIDTSKMNSILQDDKDGLYHYWSNNDANANDTVATDIEVGGKTITLGKTTVDELKDLGFTVELSGDKVQPNTVQGFSITKDNKFSYVGVQNTTDQEQDINKLVVSEFNTIADGSSMEFSYSGINSGSTLEEVIKALGTPQSNVTLSGDQADPTITLDYYNSKTEGDIAITTTLNINLLYNAEQNIATVNNINLSFYQDKIIQETTAQ